MFPFCHSSWAIMWPNFDFGNVETVIDGDKYFEQEVRSLPPIEEHDKDDKLGFFLGVDKSMRIVMSPRVSVEFWKCFMELQNNDYGLAEDLYGVQTRKNCILSALKNKSIKYIVLRQCQIFHRGRNEKNQKPQQTSKTHASKPRSLPVKIPNPHLSSQTEE